MSGIGPIALIGFGEVGQIFSRELHQLGAGPIAAFDPLFTRPDGKPSLALKDTPVEARATAVAAAKGATLVISAVTAEQTLNAGCSVVGGIEPGAFFLDINSASPGVKRETGAVIEAAKGRYVEGAVIAAVPPKGLRVPMLLGGPHAADFLMLAAPLKLDARVYSKILGQASAVKMARSVMIKGLEALMTESMLTARHYGVERDVLASLTDTIPGADWEAMARYMIMRSLQHGKRRAEEMREVAKTVAEAGVEPLMSGPIADRQDLTAALAKFGKIDPKGMLTALLDDMLAAAGHGGDQRVDETISGSAA